MQDGQGGSEHQPQEQVSAWSPQPDGDLPEHADPEHADPGQAPPGQAFPEQSSPGGAGEPDVAAGVDDTLPGGTVPPAAQGDEPDPPAPGAVWVPQPSGPPPQPGGPWTAPEGPWTAPEGQGNWPAPGQAQPTATPSPWATPPAQGLASAGTVGPWGTPPGQGQTVAGAWSILPGQGQPGQEGQPGGYQPGGYQPGGYQPGGYQPGGYGPGGYGPGGYQAGGYGPGGQGPWGPPPTGYAQPGGYQPPPPRRRRGGRLLIYALVVALAAGAGAGVAALVVPGSATPGSSSTGYSASQIPSPSNASPGTSTINVTSVASKVEPGVVDITSRLHYTGQIFEGTGMVLTSSGLVLTNNHVVAGTTHLTVRLVSSGKKYPATVIGTDATDDVALIKMVGASGLRTVQVGNSAKIRLGTPVVAIGNVGGQNGPPTVTQGSITALGRTITASDAGSGTTETLHNMLQTNAPIGEGDSGGPLSDAAGQVIGMDTAASTQSVGGVGTALGFAIPINRALSIARQIAAGHGSASIRIGAPAFIGIEVAGLPAGSPGTPQAQLQLLQQQASQNGGGVNSSNGCLPNELGYPVPASIAPVNSGTLIAGVFCGDPAAAAGLKAGDVITAVNGQAVTAPPTLTKIMTRYQPGDTVSVTWVGTGGHQHTSSLKLVAGPAK